MKRLWIFLGAGAFLLCIVTPLFAQMDIKSTGHIRVRYRDWQEFFMNDDLPTASQGGAGRDRHYFDIRTRFGVTAKIEPGLTGVIEIERYDDFGSHSIVAANASPSNTTALGIPGNSSELYFRQAWVDWVIPGTPIHIAGGRQLPTVGGAIVFSGAVYGADGIQVYSALGPGTLTAFYWKPQNDGDRRFADNDFDIYGGSYKFEWMARNGVEIYGLLSNDKIRVPAQSAYACPGVAPAEAAANNPSPGDCRQTSEYFIGANFFGVQGPFTYRLEGAYQGGTARKNVAATAALGTPAGDIDRRAGFVAGGVSYALVPQLALNLDGGWASGDDDPTDDTHTNFASIYGPFQPTLLFTEGTPFGNTAAAQIGNNPTNRAFVNTTLGTSDLDLTPSIDDNRARFSPGMFYAKPGVKWVPVKQLTINGDVALLWAAVSPGGVDSYIGTEVDIKAAWQVYKNLVVNWYFGYLFAGGFFDTGGALRAAQVGGPSTAHNVDDPWFSTIEFILTF
jgi:hypothetical protein